MPKVTSSSQDRPNLDPTLQHEFLDARGEPRGEGWRGQFRPPRGRERRQAHRENHRLKAARDLYCRDD